MTGMRALPLSSMLLTWWSLQSYCCAVTDWQHEQLGSSRQL